MITWFYRIKLFFKQLFCHHSYVHKTSLFSLSGYYICTKCNHVTYNRPPKELMKEGQDTKLWF